MKGGITLNKIFGPLRAADQEAIAAGGGVKKSYAMSTKATLGAPAAAAPVGSPGAKKSYAISRKATMGGASAAAGSGSGMKKSYAVSSKLSTGLGQSPIIATREILLNERDPVGVTASKPVKAVQAIQAGAVLAAPATVSATVNSPVVAVKVSGWTPHAAVCKV